MPVVETEFDPATGIGRLLLNRPEVLNSLDVPMAQAFLAAVRRLTGEPGLRVILLSGAGRGFCAGGDVAAFVARGQDHAAPVIQDLLDALNPAILALRQHPAPVVCAPHGVVAGAGLSLALSGDMILASEGTKFLIAYERIGAPPDCGLSWFLPRRVGRGQAFRMMLTSAELSGTEALDCGLIDQLLPPEAFTAGVEALLGQIAAGPTRAFGTYKALLDGGMSLANHLEAERDGFVAASRSVDFKEGVAAFTARRKPVFAGR